MAMFLTGNMTITDPAIKGNVLLTRKMRRPRVSPARIGGDPRNLATSLCTQSCGAGQSTFFVASRLCWTAGEWIDTFLLLLVKLSFSFVLLMSNVVAQSA